MNSLGFWVDFQDKKVVVFKEFLEAAKDKTSNEYKAYVCLQRDYPDYEIVRIDKELK